MIPLIYHPIYSDLPLPEGHRYPITKYRLLYEAIEQERAIDPNWHAVLSYVTPCALTLDEVTQVH
ncbi:histone deacetylase, partial [Vibrio sp. M260118]